MKKLLVASILAVVSLSSFASDAKNTDLKCNHVRSENGHDNACDKDPVTRHKRVVSQASDLDAVETGPAEHGNPKDSDLNVRHARDSKLSNAAKIKYDQSDR